MPLKNLYGVKPKKWRARKKPKKKKKTNLPLTILLGVLISFAAVGMIGTYGVAFPDTGLSMVNMLFDSEAYKYAMDPEVRNLTISILGDSVNSRSDYRKAKLIHDWCKANLKYVRDPEGMAYVSTVPELLKYKFGDCEDIDALLPATLLRSAGVKARIVIERDHAYAVAVTEQGEYRMDWWVRIDEPEADFDVEVGVN